MPESACDERRESSADTADARPECPTRVPEYRIGRDFVHNGRQSTATGGLPGQTGRLESIGVQAEAVPGRSRAAISAVSAM